MGKEVICMCEVLARRLYVCVRYGQGGYMYGGQGGYMYGGS